VCTVAIRAVTQRPQAVKYLPFSNKCHEIRNISSVTERYSLSAISIGNDVERAVNSGPGQ